MRAGEIKDGIIVASGDFALGPRGICMRSGGAEEGVVFAMRSLAGGAGGCRSQEVKNLCRHDTAGNSMLVRGRIGMLAVYGLLTMMKKG